jgi:hypothetical protein
LAESKPYAIAIYNIVIIGGVAYFLGAFVASTNISAGIALEITGLFLCPNISVIVIMVPKLLGMRGFISTKQMLLSSLPDSSLASADDRRSRVESLQNPRIERGGLELPSELLNSGPKCEPSVEASPSVTSVARTSFQLPRVSDQRRVVPINAYEEVQQEPFNQPDCDIVDF